MVECPLCNSSYTAKASVYKNELGKLGMIDLNTIGILMMTSEITKTGTLITTFHKPVEVSNMYVRFGYVALTIFYHSQVKISGSMNSDPIN